MDQKQRRVAGSEITQHVDLEGDGDGYSGTFRWKQNYQLASLPRATSHVEQFNYESWGTYFFSRTSSRPAGALLVQQVQSNLSIIDCLSFPLSIAYACSKSNIIKRTSTLDKLTIICLGCSSKAEERVLRETNSWEHLSSYLYQVAQIDLYLVGPEMSTTEQAFAQGHENTGNNLNAFTFKGTSIDFFRSNPSLLSNGGCIVIGFNCGFGNFENPLPGRYDLMLNWLPDLKFLTSTRLPLFFFCANDYADLKGEVLLMNQFLGATFTVTPQENPFSFASTLIPTGGSTASKYPLYSSLSVCVGLSVCIYDICMCF